ncbi:hypothetical protein DFA_01032 [Cavenderia fasciculata]|uniref:Metallo-beta-lactamase domain-containing protein n=1 Tax=Cavenderia fasciculata TaxID=261658 RepID=F4PV41_CACFS|nr:uncharacterized protein DFA_01032 [Cavenderia fasciculata]EGG21157.1 hypothetical protein DFA_01032 [Cavenderia fasciculata]|eukprot:XP_004359007.1 hypothetical protein DFA_01032 [Cavenderia fasciculata]
MKLHCLGLSPSASCYLLEYKNHRILFDCGVEWTSLLYFLPNTSVLSSSSTAAAQSSQQQNNNNNGTTSSSSNEIKNSACFKSIGNHIFIDSNVKYHTPMIFDNVQQLISDMSTIDIIVISNYNNLISLPYITEHTSFNGKIYATEPTIQIGRSNINQYWQSTELLKLIGAEQANSAFKHAKSWKTLYSRFDTEKCFEKIQAVRYNEFINLYSFTIRATSSGYCLGSCNWVIESMNEKIVYLSDSSVYERYPEPIDLQSIQSPDVFIYASKMNHPLQQPPSINGQQQHQQQSFNPYMENINELFHCIGNTISNGGSVLIPVYSCGTVLDLFELLYDYFKDKPKNAIILVESDYYQAQKLLEPFGEMKCKTQYIPIDPRIHTHDLNTLVSKISPSTIILPFQYQNKVNQSIGKTMFINPTDVLNIKIVKNGAGKDGSTCQYESAYLDQHLAQQIQTKSIDGNGQSITVAHLHASLSLKDHQFNLSLLKNSNNDHNSPGGSQKLAFSSSPPQQSSNTICNYLWGSLSLKSILEELSKRGFNNIDTIINDNVGSGNDVFSRLDNVQNATINIYKEKEMATIKLNNQGATIETSCERTRKLLMEVISTDCLQFFK